MAQSLLKFRPVCDHYRRLFRIVDTIGDIQPEPFVEVVQQSPPDGNAHFSILHVVVKCNGLLLALRQFWIGYQRHIEKLHPLTIEKYLKSILLLHRIKATDLRHDIDAALKRVESGIHCRCVSLSPAAS